MSALGRGWEDRVVDQVLAASEQERRARSLSVTRRTVDAGIELAAESGSGSFTVHEVIQRAGVSLHTFYRYFPTKDDLSLAIFEEAMRAGTEHIAQLARAEKTPLQRLRAAVVLPISDGFQHPRGLSRQFIVNEDLRLRRTHPVEVDAAMASYRRLVAEAIADAQNVGGFRGVNPAKDAEIIHQLVMGRYHVLAEGLSGDHSGSSTDDLWEFCLGALTRGDRPGPRAVRKPATRAAKRP